MTHHDPSISPSSHGVVKLAATPPDGLGGCDFGSFRSIFCWPDFYHDVPQHELPDFRFETLDFLAELLFWGLNNPVVSIPFAIFVLLVLTQPPQFWAALRPVPHTPCPECGRKQPLPPPKGRACPGCGTHLVPVDRHGRRVRK